MNNTELKFIFEIGGDAYIVEYDIENQKALKQWEADSSTISGIFETIREYPECRTLAEMWEILDKEN